MDINENIIASTEKSGVISFKIKLVVLFNFQKKISESFVLLFEL